MKEIGTLPLQLRRLRTSHYTFEDFLLRIHRTRPADIGRLYVENKLLFEHREDMLQRAVRELPWETATRLVSVAQFHQPLSAMTYRTLLGRMFRHNASQHFSAERCVGWKCALKVVADAFVAHGTTLPSSVVVCGLRLLQPSQRWSEAIEILKFSQQNEQLALPMLVEAAGCCATTSQWRKSFALLSRVHRQDPDRLIGAITSMVPSESIHSLLSSHHRTSEQLAALHVLGKVVGCAPPSVAKSNEMCLSYITHLCSSPDYLNAARLEQALGRLSWLDALSILRETTMIEGMTPSPEHEALSGGSSNALQIPLVTKETGRKNKNLEKTSAFVNDVGIAQKRKWSAHLVAALVRRLPTSTGAEELLVASSADRSIKRHHEVQCAFVEVCVREGNWTKALEYLTTINSVAENSDRWAPQLVDLLHEAKAVVPAVTIAVPSFLRCGVLLDDDRLRKVFEAILKHNSISQCGEKVSWEAALGWATTLSHEPDTTFVCDPTAKRRRKVIKAMSPRVANLLLHICVDGGSPQGAIRVQTHLQTYGKSGLTFAASDEIRALLYCMVYNRATEAQLIIKEASKKYDLKDVKPLAGLFNRWVKYTNAMEGDE